MGPRGPQAVIARIQPRPLRGRMAAIPSKSEAHRMLICAALSDQPTRIVMGPGSQDIDATVRCLTAFGAQISREADGMRVLPIRTPAACCEADCGESGSTLRFLLPVAAALGIDARFILHGRLPERPIAPLDRELERGGCVLSRPERHVLRICGQLRPGSYALPGNVSSQYISGMLFALSLLEGESALRIEGEMESASYVEMTLQALGRFGARPRQTGQGYAVAGQARFSSPGTVQVGGDWSNAAFWLCADALPGCGVKMTGLDENSAQGDRKIVDALRALESAGQDESIMDAADTPDMVPAMAACACARGQRLRVVHAERLRIKESDRLCAVTRTLNALGGATEETADGLIVRACRLRGGCVDACGDHRIAMMVAMASCACAEEVVLRGAEAVNKSYPGFWRDFAALGGCVELYEEDEHEQQL